MACILFAGGGTGGHLFPALAIAEQVTRIEPAHSCFFLCSTRKIDAEILSCEGVAHEAVPAQPFGLRPRTLARFVRRWGEAVRRSRGVIRRERSAARDRRLVVVAMGGFVAAPASRAARAERVPLALVNLDAVPGKANRWIARRADLCISAADGAPVPGSWARVPPIVRSCALPRGSSRECRQRLGLAPDLPTLLVTGGSQGAGTINRAIGALLDTAPGLFRGWQAVHQCGDTGEEEVRAAYERAGVPAVVRPFLEDMGDCWGAAEAAVGRCGAGTVAEVWASGVPSVLLPYPWHKDEHQRANAEPLVRAGGVVVVQDLIEPAATAGALGPVLEALLGDEAHRARMRAGLRTLGPADGAARAAKAVLGLLAPPSPGEELRPT